MQASFGGCLNWIRASFGGIIPDACEPVQRQLTSFQHWVERLLRQRELPIQQRLLVVANRIPVSAVRSCKASWSLEINPGGLVSALLDVKKAFEARWIGWPSVNVPDEDGQQTLTQALAVKKCIPVFLTEEIVHQYYNGYCNNILWPLFHYLCDYQEFPVTARGVQGGESDVC